MPEGQGIANPSVHATNLCSCQGMRMPGSLGIYRQGPMLDRVADGFARVISELRFLHRKPRPRIPAWNG
jgi:hypothetical protein